MLAIENMNYNNMKSTLKNVFNAENQSSNEVLYSDRKLCLGGHLYSYTGSTPHLSIDWSIFLSQSSVVKQGVKLNPVGCDGYVKLYYLFIGFSFI